MIVFVKLLQKEMNRKIEKIEHSEADPIKKALEGSHVLGDIFGRLKDFILDYTFRDEAEEINFFKEIKPRFVCRLIYYRKLYNIEMLRPVAGAENQIEYLKSHLKVIDHYSTKRLDFVRYYRAQATHLDRMYFTRGQYDIEQYLELFHHELDPRFSSNSDYKVARILLNDMLSAYLMTEIEKVEIESKKYYGFPFPDTRLTWQGSKTKLLEVIYMFDTDGCFGNVPLTKVATYIGNVFNVELEINNLSRAFSDMKIRQNPIQGIDEMSNKLLKRMKRERKKTS